MIRIIGAHNNIIIVLIKIITGKIRFLGHKRFIHLGIIDDNMNKN
jgi:hypothetical protein